MYVSFHHHVLCHITSNVNDRNLPSCTVLCIAYFNNSIDADSKQSGDKLNLQLALPYYSMKKQHEIHVLCRVSGIGRLIYLSKPCDCSR